MKIKIKHRITGAVLWAGEAESLRVAVIAAVKSGAYLADANLTDAYLAGANLAGADLTDAYLTGANLADAYLAGANLAGADLANANLAGANLAGAYLTDAYLTDAYLAGANLAGAYLANANLAGAYLAGADLTDAYLAGAEMPSGFDRAAHKDPETPYTRPASAGGGSPLTREERDSRRRARRTERMAAYRVQHPEVPTVDHLDARILRGVETRALVLDMQRWHGEHAFGDQLTGDESPEMCGTTHCRAGSAIHLAGAAGYALEKRLGSAEEAGRAIYLASTGRVPHFYASNIAALADIRRCAAEDPLPEEKNT
jgi:hypothetical protein